MRSFFQDIRFSLRSFVRTPGVTAIILLTFALGIGANTAIFTLINGVLLSKLPVPNAQELLVLGSARACCVNGGIPSNFDLFAYPQYIQLRDNNPYFSEMAAVRARTDNVRVRLSGSSAPAQTFVSRLVSANYFSVFGAKPVYGRGFLAGEDIGEGAHPVVVISDRLARRLYGNSPAAAVGSTLIVNGISLNIVGVAPQGFYGETVEVDPPDMWIPLSMQPAIMSRKSLLDNRGAFWIYPIALLKPSANVKEAEAWLKVQIQSYLTDMTGEQITSKNREDIARVNFEITSGAAGISPIRRSYAQPLQVLMAMVSVLLLICCANVANLLLARATARQHEIATKVALGASRWRIVRQVLTESALFGLAGGLAGLALAYWAAGALMRLSFRTGFVPVQVTPDARVLAFTAATVVFVTMLAGLGPAWHTARTSLVASARTYTEAEHHFGVGRALVVTQVALCMALVVVAGLFASTLTHLVDQEFGFNTSVIDVRFDPEKAGYKFNRLAQLYRDLEDRVSRVPGTESVSYAQYGPFSDNWSSSLVIPGYRSLNGDPPESRWLRVGPRYLETLGLKVVAGRGIGEQDTPQSPSVAIVNERWVRDYLGGRDPIGIQFGFEDSKDKTVFQIVGVVKDAKYQNVQEEIPPTFYLPMMQKSGLRSTPEGYDDSMYAHDILVRTSGNPEVAADAIRRAILEVEPDMPIRYTRTIHEQVLQTVRAHEVIQRLSTAFGVIALLIAAIGLYGLMMYRVVRRTRELGIRFALGADTKTVVSMIMRQSLALVGVGIAIGLPLTWAGGRIAAGMLYGVTTHDPVVLSFAVVTLAVVAAIAALLPAKRASQVDPAVVLRAE